MLRAVVLSGLIGIGLVVQAIQSDAGAVADCTCWHDVPKVAVSRL